MPAVWRPIPETVETSKSIEDTPVQFSRPLTLAAVPTAVSAARRYVRDELAKVKLAALVDDAELVVSELVTNAVMATGFTAPNPKWPELEGLAVIRIRVGFSLSCVLVEVWDRDAKLPIQQQNSEYAESGRGLLIVSALCASWNARTVPGGKVVCGELAIPEELSYRMLS